MTGFVVTPPSRRRVCLVSHRLGGPDGVEAATWISGFRSLGWPVTRAAGFFADHEHTDVVVRGLWADQPGGDPPPVDHATIARLCSTHDLLVLDDAGSSWSAPRASLAWQRYALAAHVPTIVRHHEPTPWTADAGAVPLHHPNFLHVLADRPTRDEFAARWPVLAESGALRVRYDDFGTADLPAELAELAYDATGRTVR